MGLVIALLLTGCSIDTGQQGSGDLIDETSATVSVESRDITSTLVLSGRVVSNPVYLVNSPVTGTLSFTANATTSETLDAGVALAAVSGTPVTMQAPSTIVSLLQTSGTTVVANVPLAQARYAGFGISVQVPAEQIFRLYETPTSAKVSVAAGPSGIYCMLQPEALSLESTIDSEAAVGFVCLLPLDAAVVSGLDAKIGLQTGFRESALALPLQAVSGTSTRGQNMPASLWQGSPGGQTRA